MPHYASYHHQHFKVSPDFHFLEVLRKRYFLKKRHWECLVDTIFTNANCEEAGMILQFERGKVEA